MMRVLSVASECAPLVKTGGLADVAGALPGALAGQGVDMRVLLPGYKPVMAALDAPIELTRVDDLFGASAQVLAQTAKGVPVLVLDAPHLYERDHGIYLDGNGQDWADNPQRFAALSLVAARIARDGLGDWRPDVVHGHDWQAGFAPYYLHKLRVGVPSVMTIHNIAFAGHADPGMMGELLLDPADYTPEGFEFWGRVSSLKAGLNYCDKITTVSPTYARELTTDTFGMGFEGLIRARQDDLTGILNGIDLAVWDPANDTVAPHYKSLKGKEKAKKALRAKMGLPDADGPLAVVVSRLTEQKGLDLTLDGLEPFLSDGGQIALLGSGASELERAWEFAAARHDGLAVRIGYDEDLAHLLIAGGDAVLVPSRFEPCGLTQLYGLRYGTIPVVANTGGLADTVIDANDAAVKVGVCTGIMHTAGRGDATAHAMKRLLDLYADRDTWSKMVKNAMRHPVGWDSSAAEYAALYRSLI
ncbi:glycogen synthase GlgA [Maribius pontilimi]|uniref:Glycogen synthase n=2 Tax=Palleronia pontilimi TaxID=1964209 RepID=A0A934II89_9RHOB|nr:glycogen synthase GlgA [Palleronia pontilimi]MBJ3763055.1 glycogen synthase GlgA [Palleronia pontilimi]